MLLSPTYRSRSTGQTDMSQPKSDTYRAGDTDFDLIRERFYSMVRRQLSHGTNPTSRPEKKQQKAKKAQTPAIHASEMDGRPSEVERYGDPAKIMYRDNASSALNWLIYKGHLNSRVEGDRSEKAMEIAWSEGRGRINTATRLEEIFERAELTPLRSPDFEAIPGGSFGPREIGSVKLHCIRIIAQIEGDIPPHCTRILREIICENKFIWHGLAKKSWDETMEFIRMSFDFAAWSLDRHHPQAEMTSEEIVRRWPAAHDWFTMRRLLEFTVYAKRDRPSGQP